jgi:hypothetical protein
MEFRHERVDPDPPCGRLGICLPTDLTGNGRPDVIVGGMGDPMPVSILGKRLKLRLLPYVGDVIRRLETSLFWYENPGWERHALSRTPDLYVFGNALGDLTGDGRVDLAVGQGLDAHDVYWFEQPADPREPWDRRLVTDRFDKYHDLLIDDIDDDGALELVGLSQESETVFYFDVPEDPRREPWPADNLHVVDERNVEGVAAADVDRDGTTELIAGPRVYRQVGDRWASEDIVEGWDWTRIATGDLDGDGQAEVVLTEGDSPYLGTRPGRVGWFDPPDWSGEVLRDDMFCPHTVQLADFDGSGRLDIYVAEMGLGENDDPEHVVFRNRGGGEFEPVTIARGVPTHEARAVDLTGNGRPDIVGKSYTPTHHVDVWYNET